MRNNNQMEARRWLQQAEFDLRVARWNARGEFWSQVCFMSQQTAEKALKAYLYAVRERNIAGHALLELVRRCSNYDEEFRNLFRECRRLSRYYIITRYPNSLLGPIPAEHFDQEEAEEAMQMCERIINIVAEKINALNQE